MSKRRFFQMHLSTAVVLMLVAGVLVWANVRADRETVFLAPDNPFACDMVYDYWGWPFQFLVRWTPVSWNGEPPELHSGHAYYRTEVFYNALIALAILLAVWQLCEWRIRRREAK